MKKLSDCIIGGVLAAPLGADHEVTQLLDTRSNGVAMEIESLLDMDLAGAEQRDLGAADTGRARGIALAVALDGELHGRRQLDDANRRRRRWSNRDPVAGRKRGRSADGFEK